MKKTFFMMFAATLVFFGCEQEVPEASSSNSDLSEEKVSPSEWEVALPEIEGEPVTFTTNDGQEVTILNKNGQYVWMGDVLLSDEQVAVLKDELANGRTGITTMANYWPNGVVYYQINPSLPNQSRVTNAINHWKQKAPYLDFRLRTSSAITDYVYFTTGSGCTSYIGRIGGRQDITLATGCTTGSTIHEIGHALGLFHEQNRSDRNNYINVYYNNIQPQYTFAFDTYVQRGIPGFEIGTLDFNSIMLYGSYAFSANGQPTITKKDGSTYTENRTALSQGDVDVIDIMYGPDVSGAPYARIVYENEYTEYDNTFLMETADVYVEFYNDAAFTQPYTLTSTITFKYKEVTEYQSGSTQVSNRSKTISSGSQKVLLDGYFVLREYSWDQNGYEPGSYDAEIEAVDGTGYSL